MDARLRTAEIAMGLLVLVFCVVAWILSEPIPKAAQLFPRIVLSIMGAAAVIVFVRGLAKRHDMTSIHLFGEMRPFLAVMLALIVYIIAINTLGYFTATVVFIPIVPLILRARRFLQSVFVAVAFCIAVYLVIILAFERPLPPEIWLEWWMP